MPACVAHADKAYQSSTERRHAIDKAINNSNERNAATTPRLKNCYFTQLEVREYYIFVAFQHLAHPVSIVGTSAENNVLPVAVYFVQCLVLIQICVVMLIAATVYNKCL